MSAGTFAREYVVDANLSPKGYEQVTDISSVTSLTPPTDSRIAIIQVKDQAARWRDDGTEPSATVGMPIGADLDILYTGDLTAFRIIEQTSGAELNVSYYG